MPLFPRMGAQLAKLRKQQGLTQKALAAAVGTNERQLQRWENGEQLPRRDNILLLAEVLHVTPGELVSPGPQPKPHNGNGNGHEDDLELLLFETMQRLESMSVQIGTQLKKLSRRVAELEKKLGT